ncbi:MAG: tetratricopeptide repeat protein [Luteibaculaceae bacterium]
MKTIKFLLLLSLLIGSSSISAQIIPEAFLYDSRKKLDNDRLNSAIKKADIASSLDTTRAKFIGYKAFLQTLGGEKENSNKSLLKAERIEPNYGKNKIYRAFWYETFYGLGTHKDTILNLLDEGVEMARNKFERAEFQHDRAIAYERMGIVNEKIITDLEEAVANAPRNMNYTESLAIAYHNFGEYRKSNEVYKVITATDSMNFGMLNNIALNHIMLGEYDKALTMISDLLARDKQDPYVNNNLGFAYLKMGDLRKSKKYINRSIKNNKDNPYSYRNKSYLYIVKGNQSKACKNIEIAQERGLKNDAMHNLNELQNIACVSKDLEGAKRKIGF